MKSNVLHKLFEEWAGEPCVEVLALAANGSARRYYRMRAASGRTAIGTINDDVAENQRFLAMQEYMHAHGIKVPEVYGRAADDLHYLQQDLGDRTLYNMLLDKRRAGQGFDKEMLSLYQHALRDLAQIQAACRGQLFANGNSRPVFDRRAMLWDLNYFKYYFLKLAQVPFNDDLLEDDFEHFIGHLQETDCEAFIYRDFQARNIMIVSDVGSNIEPELYYIDFQGGRKGAAQYDVASLLYSAKSEIPEAIRNELLEYYVGLLGLNGTERRQWVAHYRLYTYMRMLQTLGAYGFRGLYEHKDYFVQSIPLALGNLRRMCEEHPLPDDMPHLKEVLRQLAENNALTPTATKPPADKLTVTVQSFSYRKGLPTDPSGNGGGHVFDCRALPNPGRIETYKTLTGCSRPVIEYLQKQPEVEVFLSHAEAIVRQSVERYLERHFSHLSVAFGCTGGQHRSVYCAERLSATLRQMYPQIEVELIHREQ